jgi:Ni/Co efflux regulator RcnB
MEFHMLKQKIACALVALSFTLPGLAFAHGRDDGHNRGHDQRAQKSQHRGPSHQHQSNRHKPQPKLVYRPVYQERLYERANDRGAGYNHNFHRGDRLPMQYRHHQYVVDDWRGHHLQAPPRGYHWVQTGGDYVLVAIATGIILQLILSH